MRWLVLAVLTALLCACTATPAPVGGGLTVPTEASATASGGAAGGHSTPRGPSTSAAQPSATADSVSLAVRDATAAQRGVPAADVEVLTLEPVVWPDSSLGCPEPDQMYLQVLTPGYRVTVEVSGERLEVHTDRGNPPRVVTCARPGPPVADTNR